MHKWDQTVRWRKSICTVAHKAYMHAYPFLLIFCRCDVLTLWCLRLLLAAGRSAKMAVHAKHNPWERRSRHFQTSANYASWMYLNMREPNRNSVHLILSRSRIGVVPFAKQKPLMPSSFLAFITAAVQAKMFWYCRPFLLAAFWFLVAIMFRLLIIRYDRLSVCLVMDIAPRGHISSWGALSPRCCQWRPRPLPTFPEQSLGNLAHCLLHDPSFPPCGPFYCCTLYGPRTEGSATHWSPCRETQVPQSDHTTPRKTSWYRTPDIVLHGSSQRDASDPGRSGV